LIAFFGLAVLVTFFGSCTSRGVISTGEGDGSVEGRTVRDKSFETTGRLFVAKLVTSTLQVPGERKFI
jgi:hypothetical protein